jgi:tetratricopeptide (TPR) repeat protein
VIGEKHLQRRWPMCLGLALLTLAAYWPTAQNDFVNYDDSDYVTANSHVQTGLNWQNTCWAFTTGHASNWHPLTWLSHGLDCQIFGPTTPAERAWLATRSPEQQAGAHHLVNLAFHLANTLLLFLVLRRMTGAHWRSGLVAALFAVHPLHVESVAWVSERKDVLSTSFLFLTLWHYQKYVASGGCRGSGDGEVEGQSPKAKVRRPEVRGQGSEARGQRPEVRSQGSEVRGQRSEAIEQAPSSIIHHPSSNWITRRASLHYMLALFFFALGLMSKPMLVTVPFLLLLLDWWPLERFDLKDSSLAKKLLSLFGEKIPFLILSLASSIVTFEVQKHGGAVSTVLSPAARLANALVSYARYLGKCFWPPRLSVLYPHPGNWPVWEVAGSAVLLLAISAGVACFVRRRPYLAVGWLWFLGGLVPVIGVVQVGIQSMADRYTYVPLIGIFIMVVWGLAEFATPSSSSSFSSSSSNPRVAQARKSRQPGDAQPAAIRAWRPQTIALAGAAAVALAACVLLTLRQVRYWRNSETLFLRAVEVSPNNYLAYNNIGFYLSKLPDRSAEAIDYYRKSLAINPAYEDALNNLGYALAAQKHYTDAIGWYRKALQVRPGHVEVNNNLGNALSEIGQIDEAIQRYRFVLQRQSDHADAHNNLGIALAMQGKLDEAIPHFRDAIRFKPNYASAHSNLGNALAAQHKLDEAIREYQESLRLSPEDPQAHNNLGNALAEQGRLNEAIPHYNEALRLNANNPEAHFNLGIALARQGQRDAALAHYTEALRLKPDYAEARRQIEALSTPANGSVPPRTNP